MSRLAALLVFTTVLAACGGTVDSAAPPQAQAQGPVFLARAAGPTGPVTGYDASGLARRFQLPGGLHAADGRSAYAVESGKLLRYSTRTGRVTRTYPLRGEWELTGVSATGAFVALQRPGTRVLVLDTKRGTTVRELTLRGNFRVETVSAAGDFLFLQQNFVGGGYAVRGYDLAAGRLLAGSLGRKGEVVEMQGLAGQVLASPDGRWLLTLYVNTQTNTAFVHALNLIERIAICINMPPCTKCAPEALKRWGLALSPDGRTLFAANPALGRVATIYLPAWRVIQESRFAPETGGETRTAISPDGSQFVFTNGRTLWSFDTNRGWARTLPTGAGRIADLGFGADSGTLILVGEDGPSALEL